MRAHKFEIGDRVRFVEGTMVWGGRHVRDAPQTGTVIAYVNDGTAVDRVTVKFDDE